MNGVEIIPLQFDENLKEILAQHKLILQMNARIIEIMCMPPIITKELDMAQLMEEPE